jgi:hypothetical protein
MPHSLARLSASASSHRNLSSAVFITNIAESDFSVHTLVVWASRKLVRAVKWQEDRSEGLRRNLWRGPRHWETEYGVVS